MKKTELETENVSTVIAIELSTGKVLNLLKDGLTTQDMREMSGVEV